MIRMEDINMLTSEQYNIITSELSKDSASEFVHTLINAYSSTVAKTTELLEYIPSIAQKQLKIKQAQVNEYAFGTDLLIADRYTHPGKYTKKDTKMRFCSLYYVCKAHFKQGNAEKDSIAGKAFFNEFVDMLRNKAGFDYTDEDDWNWVKSISGGEDWLELVIQHNIDNQFIKP